MVCTPSKVDASGATQRSGQPAAEGSRRGERRPAWPMGQAARHRHPPPPGAGPHLNGVDARVEVEGPRGVAVAAVRGWRWWCHCRGHHGHRRGFCGCRATVGGTVVSASGLRRPSEVVAQHTSGRHSSPRRRRS
jgi:hypothetical protein